MANAGHRRFAWVTALVVALCLLPLLWPPLTAGLVFDRAAILDGELWRLWSGQLVFFSLQHLLFDCVVLGVVGALAERELGSRFVGELICLAMPLIALGLLALTPGLVEYRGISALSCALAFAAGRALWRTRPALRPLLVALTGGFVAKVAGDAGGWQFSAAGLPPGVRIVWQAHLIGAGLGWLAGTYQATVSKPIGAE